MEPITSGRTSAPSMRHPEIGSFGHWSGFRIVRASIGLGLAGTAPLVLHAVVGPPGGSPIGLGLLAMATVPFALVGVAVGATRMIVQRLLDGGR